MQKVVPMLCVSDVAGTIEWYTSRKKTLDGEGLDPAVVPDRKSSPQRSLITVAAGFIGLLGSVVYVLGIARVRRDRIITKRLSELSTCFVSRRRK